MDAPDAIGRVTRRADYLAANSALRAPMPGFVLLVRPRGDGSPQKRIGITVSGKVGGAVVRNRMKRRFRELARKVLPEAGLSGADHILIGRTQGIERDYAMLETEFRKALRKLSARAEGGNAAPSSPRLKPGSQAPGQGTSREIPASAGTTEKDEPRP